MTEHLVPEKLRRTIIADLVSRIAEMGRERPEGADEALAILRSLPEIGTETELDIEWYSAGEPPASATLNLTSRHVLLSISDGDGSQELYSCEAGFHPEVDRSELDAWLQHLRTLDAPEIAISIWVSPAEQ